MKRARMFMVILAVICVCLALVAGCKKAQPAANDANYVVQLGYYNCDHMVAACVAKDAGIFKDLGLNVNVTGNGQVPQAMSAAKLDVGYVGIEGVLLAHQKGAPIFVAANNHRGGSYYLVASNAIKDPKDLVGKRVSLEADADKANPSWCAMADQLGIPRDPKQYKDYDMDIQNKFLAIQTGQLDGYITCDPWASMAEYSNVGHIVASYTKLPDGTWGACCTYVMRKEFAQEHPDLAKKMLLAHSLAIEYIYLHPYKTAQIFANNYSVPVDVALMTIYKKTVAEGRSLIWQINQQEMTNYFENAKKMGLADFQTYEPVNQFVDTTLLSQSGVDDFDKFIKTKVDPVFPVGMSFLDWKNKAMEIDG